MNKFERICLGLVLLCFVVPMTLVVVGCGRGGNGGGGGGGETPGTPVTNQAQLEGQWNLTSVQLEMFGTHTSTTAGGYLSFNVNPNTITSTITATFPVASEAIAGGLFGGLHMAFSVGGTWELGDGGAINSQHMAYNIVATIDGNTLRLALTAHAAGGSVWTLVFTQA